MIERFIGSLFLFIFYALFAFSNIVAIIGIFNLIYFRKAKSEPLISEKEEALVSILIPARNEQENIKRCLYSLFDQDYNNIEIIVLDDESDDDTFSLVKKISQEDNRLRVVKGTSVPKSWTGKNWACHQLSKLAKGDFYLFVDADTKLQATLINETISEMKRSDIDLISLFPKRITSTLVDKIISITIGWLIFSCLPLLLANKNPMFSSAFGQFLLFRRGAYKSIGGHEGIKSKILDDFELGRSITRNGLVLKLFDGTDRISTFSYSSEKEALDGFSKSIFPFFNNRIMPFLILWVLFLSSSMIPFIVLFGDLVDIRLSRSKEVMTYLIWGSLTISWVISSYRSKQGITYGLLFPIVTIVTALLGIFSVLSFAYRNVRWKDRNVIDTTQESSNVEEID
ncbi:MAG: glycosyltransferase [Chloroflexota bacterium]